MGYSKKLQNVLGGVTSSIISNKPSCVNPYDSQILQNCICNFSNIAQMHLTFLAEDNKYRKVLRILLVQFSLFQEAALHNPLKHYGSLK